MTVPLSPPDSPAPQLPALFSVAGSPLRGPLLMLGGGLALSEGLGCLLHLDGTAMLGGGALAGAWWLLSRRRVAPKSRLPDSLDGLLDHCQALLDQFQRLGAEEDRDCAAAERQTALQALSAERRRSTLLLALTGGQPPDPSLQAPFQEALRSPHSLQLQWGRSLPGLSPHWCWGEAFERCDLLLFHLRPPLRASDLRWLQAVPESQPLWLLLEADAADPAAARLEAEVLSLWPAAASHRCLHWNGASGALAGSLAPLADWLAREGAQLPARTAHRRLEALHGNWQAELERLRRRELQRLLQRTQWLVAGGVIAAPVASLDLLVLAAANGLMLQEMARLWDCPWQAGSLRLAAIEVARASLALGLVEWSSHALASALRLHHAGWLVGSTLQALSAAYLTRVVGHAMADVLALSAGVSEPDLEAIKRQAPLLVARAAESARLDWPAFLEQGRAWLLQRPPLQPGAV
jgi:hypothetical protein